MNSTGLPLRTLGVIAFRRRLLLACIVICVAMVAAVPMARTLSQEGWTVLKVSFLALFFLLLTQVSFGFATAAIGWWVLRTGQNSVRINPRSPLSTPKALPAIAIVMPVYNEEVTRIFQGLRIMYESLQMTGRAQSFDFFILSDTNDPNCWIAEEKAWFDFCKQVGGFGRIFYRKRRVQLHNKSGNIADFCRRWGASYRYMIVLDADSVMTGTSFVQLADLMEQNAQVGIIQTSPRPILGKSLFQRIEQFAAFVYRPVFAAGANFWQLGEATFWGHNAIIRLKPFMQYCAMPELPEVGPLGKRVLSHDTIEAALIQRAGYQVWQAYDLEGSYEESPPHLLASLQRDRRWCHGNLQHLWFLFERRLKAVSRFNILNGILAYGSSPLWFLSLILGGLVALHQPNGGSTTTSHPALVSGALYAYVMCLLLLPKILGATFLMQSSEKLRLCGGGIKVALGVVAETVYSMLTAPILMLFYTRFVLTTFFGIGVRWGRQIRSDARGPGWRTWVETHGANFAFVLVATALVAWKGPSLLLWLTPVVVGPLLAIPLSQMTASTRLGIKAKNKNWFLIPEEVAPSEEVAKLEGPTEPLQSLLFNSTDYAADYGLLQAVLDPYINSIHVSLLRLRTEPNPRTRDNMELFADRLLLEGPSALTPAEKKTLLWDAEMMLELHRRLWSSPAFQLHEWWQEAFRHYVESSALFTRRTVAVLDEVPSTYQPRIGECSKKEALEAAI